MSALSVRERQLGKRTLIFQEEIRGVVKKDPFLLSEGTLFGFIGIPYMYERGVNYIINLFTGKALFTPADIIVEVGEYEEL